MSNKSIHGYKDDECFSNKNSKKIIDEIKMKIDSLGKKVSENTASTDKITDRINFLENKVPEKNASRNWAQIASATIATIALIFSILTFCQNNKIKKIEKYKVDARKYFDSGMFDESYDLYKKVKSLDPNDPEGYLMFLKEGKYLFNHFEGQYDPYTNLLLSRADTLKPKELK